MTDESVEKFRAALTAIGATDVSVTETFVCFTMNGKTFDIQASGDDSGAFPFFLDVT